jgi:hypothetical protein
MDVGALAVAGSVVLHVLVLLALGLGTTSVRGGVRPAEPLPIEVTVERVETPRDRPVDPDPAEADPADLDPDPGLTAAQTERREPTPRARTRAAPSRALASVDPGRAASRPSAAAAEPAVAAAARGSRWFGMRSVGTDGIPGADGSTARLPLPGEIGAGMERALAAQWAAEPVPEAGLPLGPIDGETPRGRPLLVADGDGGYRHERRTFMARVARDGSIKFSDGPNLQVDGFEVDTEDGFPIKWKASFDLTDAIMRAYGEDPYRYEKHKVMEATREQRAVMAEHARRERLRQAVLDLPKALHAVWVYPDASPEEKRYALFTLWDDCADEGDERMLRAAEEARASILAFIRRTLPEGSADGYDADELARLNAERRSTRPFDPYGEQD